MKINLLFTVLMIMVAIALCSVNDRAESLDITKIVQGTLKEAGSHYFRIVEDTDGKEIQIAIDPNTVYNNVQKRVDFKAGDKVQIDYKTNNNKRIAITITKLEVEGDAL